VRVDFERELDRRMPQNCAHSLDELVICKQQGRTGMAQIVKSDVW
jgi:hypothetical protein